MSSLKGSKVVAATLHGTIHVAGVGQLGPSLSSTQNGVSKAVDMTLEDGFLIGRVKGVTIAIPLTNVTHMVVAENVNGASSKA